jgi:hypothetical protein
MLTYTAGGKLKHVLAWGAVNAIAPTTSRPQVAFKLGRGSVCYGFYPHGAHPAGKGTQYRASVEGPGVTPDVMWQEDVLGDYDKTLDLQANDALRALGDPQCKPN